MRLARMFLALSIALLCPGVFATGAQASLTGATSVVARGLELPWDVVRLPDGRTLVTERPGRVRVIGADGALRAAPVYADASAAKFLGLVKDPAYARTRFVYLYVSYGPGANPNANRIIRLTDNGTNLVSPVTIYNGGIRSDGNHDGGRIAFGPDGMLYATTGDIHDPSLPRNLDSANGKILRMTSSGAPAPGNPFPGAGPRGYVWSYGHRHPQGIGWDYQGRMWESEHGPSGEAHAGQGGGATGNDEINRIVRGGDYGWPTVVGDQTTPGARNPVVHANSSPAWAPGGLTFGPDRVMYVPFLAGQQLHTFTTSGDAIIGQETLYPGTFGRLRAATADATHLWLTTSNDTNDERVLRVAFDPASIPRPASPPAATRPTRAQLRAIVRGLLARQAKALRSKRARRLAKVRRLRLRDQVLPAGRLSVRLDRPGVKGRRKRVRVLSGKARTQAGRKASVNTKLATKGRRMLRAAGRRTGRLKLSLRVGLRTADGRLTTGRRTVTIRRR